MAWEQILTSGTPINKLADVDETGSSSGDLLIWSSDDSAFVTNRLNGTSYEATVDNAADGNITIGLPDNVKVAGTLDIGGGAGTTGATISSAGAITCDADITVDAANGADAVLTLNGGATAKGAVIKMYADASDDTIDKWDIKVADGGLMTFSNGASGESLLEVLPHATPTSSKTTVAGQLHVDGNLIKIGGDSTIGYESGNLTITESLVTISDALLANVSVTAPLVKGSTEVQTPAIKYTDGDLALTIADGGKVTSSGDIQVGASLQTATIDYTDGDLAMTIADGGGVTFDEDIVVTGTTGGGGKITFGNSESIDNESNGTINVTASALKVSGDLNVNGQDINFYDGGATARLSCAAVSGDNQAGSALIIKAGQGTGSGAGGAITFEVADGGQEAASVANGRATALTIADDRTVTTAYNLVVGGDLQVDGDLTTVNTETILLADAIIHLNYGLGSGEPAYDAGIKVDRGNATDVGFFWDESADTAAGPSSIEASTTYGGAWAMGSGDSGLGANVDFGTIHGWVVGVTHAGSGTQAADAKATGLGSLFVNTTTDAVYIRVS